MAGQGTLILIDENDKKNAGISANNFAKEDTRNRAYYNDLGARLVQKFLASENIDVSEICNIHKIHKIIEEFDISDIMLKNIHMDVRVVFNENFIFIPKSHFIYDILPDIYLVLLMSNDKKSMRFLGFFEPKLINKNNQNEEYYFIEKEKLTPVENLKEFISNFEGNTAQNLSDSELEEADFRILSLIDHDIDENGKKQLLKSLVKSAKLRDRFIEFENFELLSYRAQNSKEVTKPSDIDISYEKAAEATAKALDKFNEKTVDKQEAEIMNSFNELDRNIPDLTPEIIEDEENIIAEASSLTEAAETFAEEPEVEQMTGMPDFSDLEDLTIGDMSELNDKLQGSKAISDKTESYIPEQNISAQETADGLELSDLEDFSIEAEKNTSSENNLEEVLTPVDFDEFEHVHNNSAHEEYQTETIDLEDIEIPSTDTVETNVLKEEIPPETIDLEEIELVDTEPHHIEDKVDEALSFEDLGLNAHEEKTENPQLEEVSPETMDFEEIKVSDNLEELNFDEPSFELENIDNINLEEPSKEHESVKATIESEKLMPEELMPEELQISEPEPEMVFDENLTEDLNLEEELSLEEPAVDSLHMEESVETEPLQKHPEETQNPEPQTDELSNFEALIPETNSTLPESFDEKSLSAEDKELDQLLNMEDFGISEEKSYETPNNIIEKADNIDSITGSLEELENTDNDKPEILSSTASPDEISINDLKEVDASFEEVKPEENQNDISTSDLISEIDDLLGESEEENTKQDSSEDKLEVLFNSSESHEDNVDETFLDNDGGISENTVSMPEKGKKVAVIAAAAALVGVLAVAGGVGFFMKNKNNSDVLAQNPIDENIPTAGEDTVQTPDNTDLMTNNSAPAQPAPSQASPSPAPAPAAKPTPAPETAKKPSPKAEKPAAKQEQAAPASASAQQKKPSATPVPYISVKSLTWEVPDYLSYSDKVKRYLQTAGKSIRLSLSSDLLLATEYAYSNQVKVELKLKNDGTVENIQITKSSGSNQINDIVLRTVKETMKVVKPAPGEIPTPNFKLGLIINL